MNSAAKKCSHSGSSYKPIKGHINEILKNTHGASIVITAKLARTQSRYVLLKQIILGKDGIIFMVANISILYNLFERLKP